jgi:hypothetical protein
MVVATVNNEVFMSLLDSITKFFGFGGEKPQPSVEASPYYQAISQHFGLDHEPTPWPWGKKGRPVATNELPPQRIPVTGRNAPLPHGIREAKRGEPHQGWREWEPKVSDRQRMTDYLRDGAVSPDRGRQR